MKESNRILIFQRGFSINNIAQVSGKVVYIPLLAKTHLGNTHTMVRWTRRPDGTYDHDFSLVERYLDTAIKHLGRVPVVNFYCWEMFTGGKYFEREARPKGKGMCFTTLDPKTGKIIIGQN